MPASVLRPATRALLPVLFFAIAALILTWPLPRHLSTHAAGVGYGDTYMMLRQAWEAHQRLAEGHNPLHQALIAYPDGITSRLMWSTPLRWLPIALLMAVFPPLTAFNLWLLVTLALNGLAAYALGLALTGGQRAAALLGGLVFMAFPNMQGHLSVGHMDVLAMFGLPLFALCWWRVMWQGAGWRSVIAGGACFALAALGLTSQIIYNLLPIVLFSGLYLLIAQRARLAPRGARWHAWPLTRGAAMVALGGAILLVFFAPLLTAAGRAEIAQIAETGRITFSADLLAFVSPSPFGPLADLGLVPDYARDVLGTNSAEGAAYVGLSAGLLALLGILRCRAARPWLAIALGAALFSLGPLLKWRDAPVTLRVEQVSSHIALPWAALQDLPVLSETRTPGRFNGATALAWGALVSLGASVALAGRRRAVQAGAVIVFGGAILLEYQLFWPFPTGSADQGPYFAQLAQMDEVDAVLNVPVQHPTAQMQAMFQQTIHAKAMIGGQLYRRSPQDPALLALLDWAALGGPGADLFPIGDDAARDLIAASGADRVILHTRFVPDPVAAAERLQQLFGTPEFTDRWHVVFRVPSLAAPAADPVPVIAPGAAGWSDPVALEAFIGRFLAEAGEWSLYAPHPFTGDLLIPVRTYAIARQIAVYLDEQLVGAFWAGTAPVRLPLRLTSGTHVLRFEAPGGCTPYPFTLTCLMGDCAPLDPPVCLSVALGAPVWEPPALPIASLDVQLDHGLRLSACGAVVDREAGTLRVRLYWQAPGPLPDSYALFVHLADLQSAAPYAQYADFPAIPTDAWDSGAAWVSDVSIPLPEGLTAGDYALNTGWFVPGRGTRLAVQGPGRWSADGIVFLQTITLP